MGVNLSGRSFLKLLDFTPAEINYLLDLSREFKNMKRNGVPHRYLEGKNVVLLFQKTSTRTRCAFEVGAMDLGMGVTYLDPNSSQMGKKESVQDSAYVFGRMFDGIQFRGFKQSDVDDLAKYSGIPVWNGLTDDFHPTQMLADVLTIQDEFGQNVKGKKMVFFGDARNNVANSLMVVSAKLGMHFVACGPKELMPAEDLVKTCKEVAKETGAIVTAEEHSIVGGLGSAVSEVVTEEFPVPVVKVGIKDTFGESGKPDQLLEKYGLTVESIVNSAKRAISLKK